MCFLICSGRWGCLGGVLLRLVFGPTLIEVGVEVGADWVLWLYRFVVVCGSTCELGLDKFACL